MTPSCRFLRTATSSTSVPSESPTCLDVQETRSSSRTKNSVITMTEAFSVNHRNRNNLMSEKSIPMDSFSVFILFFHYSIIMSCFCHNNLIISYTCFICLFCRSRAFELVKHQCCTISAFFCYDSNNFMFLFQ